MTYQAEEGSFMLSAQVVPIGQDLLVIVTGGVSHIGSISIATPRPSLADEASTSATVSTFCYPSHKDDGVGNRIAHGLSAKLSQKVVVVCGVHYDNVTSEELATLLRLSDELLSRLLWELPLLKS